MNKNQTTTIVLTNDEQCSSQEFSPLKVKVKSVPGLFENFECFKGAIESLEDNSPVLFISKQHPYPRKSLSFVPDFWNLYKGNSFGFLNLMFNHINGTFVTTPPYFLLKSELTLILHLFYACFNSSDLKQYASDITRLKYAFDTSIFSGLWLKLPETRTTQWDKASARINQNQLAPKQQVHLIKTLPNKPDDLAQLAGSADSYIQDIFHQEITTSIAIQVKALEFYVTQGRILTTFKNIFAKNGVLYLANAGKKDLISEALKKYFSLAYKAGPPDANQFRALLDLAQRTGCMKDVVQSTASLPKLQLVTKPELIEPWLRATYLSGEQEDFIKLIFELTAEALNKQSKRALHRLNRTLLENAAPDAHFRFLQQIATSPCADILSEHDFLRPIADGYLVGNQITSPVENLFDLEQLTATQSIDTRLRGACILQQTGLVTSALSELFWSGTNLEKWLLGLAAYSNELGSLNIKISDIDLPKPVNKRHAYILATLLKDIGYLSTEVPGNYGEHIGAVSQSQKNDYGYFRDFLSQLRDGQELKHPKISGASVIDVFNSLKFDVDECSVDYGKVSVIMTAFNPDVELLKLSLDSIANQSYKNYEILFIDDASDYEKKDELQTLVNKYQNTRFIKNKTNTGPYSGRNAALEIATGDFIAIQDADDFSHPQRFERQLKTFHSNDYVKLVASQHVRIDKYGTIQFEAGFRALGDGTMTSMFRKGVFEEVDKFLAVRSRGDVEMRERIISHYGAPAYTELDYPLVYCFADANTLSQTIARERRGALSIFREAISNAYNRPEKTFNKPLVPISLRV